MTGRMKDDGESVTFKIPKSIIALIVLGTGGGAISGWTGVQNLIRSEKPYNVVMQLPPETKKQIDEATESIDSLEKGYHTVDKNMAMMSKDMQALTASLREFVDETKENRKATWEAINDIRKVRTP